MLPQKQRENTSCTFLGPNLPDVWVLSENTSPHTLTTGSSQSVDDGHSATILEGTSIATEIKLKVAEEISRMKSEIGKFPKLVMVLVGDRRDSHRLIDVKLEACEKVGIEIVVSKLPENCTQKELLDVVSSFNDDKDVHGIVVQLPLPQRNVQGGGCHDSDTKFIDMASTDEK
ncbi:amino acid dehydrogenase family protein, partial [Trifolium pratense]